MNTFRRLAVKAAAILLSGLFLISCSTGKYLTDADSIKRHKEMRKERTKLNIAEALIATSTLVLAAATEGGMTAAYVPETRQFKKMKFENISADTLYINMLTDCQINENEFYDFMDIKLPPQKICKLLMPINIDYNIYFRNTREPDGNEEMIEINSASKRKIILYSGMTIQHDEFSEKQETYFDIIN